MSDKQIWGIRLIVIAMALLVAGLILFFVGFKINSVVGRFAGNPGNGLLVIGVICWIGSFASDFWGREFLQKNDGSSDKSASEKIVDDNKPIPEWQATQKKTEKKSGWVYKEVPPPKE